jgi:16S rRNA (adenine(1408)-N(1))-methyltransferase
VTVDLGTGDGRAVLRAARAEPDRLAIGIDADAGSMRASARRAERRDAFPNTLFVVSSVEFLPDDLDALADRVTVSFPWGSLLRGLAETQGHVLAAIERICVPEASIEVVWSVIPRDGTPRVDPGEVAEAFRRSGFGVRELREATLAEIEATHSSWAKRLRAGHARPAHILRALAPPDGRKA